MLSLPAPSSWFDVCDRYGLAAESNSRGVLVAPCSDGQCRRCRDTCSCAELHMYPSSGRFCLVGCDIRGDIQDFVHKVDSGEILLGKRKQPPKDHLKLPLEFGLNIGGNN